MKRLFDVGQEVICINDNFRFARSHYPGLICPTFGLRYIVRGYVTKGKFPAIVLKEIINQNVQYFDGTVKEAGFWHCRFVGAPPPLEVEVHTSMKEDA